MCSTNLTPTKCRLEWWYGIKSTSKRFGGCLERSLLRLGPSFTGAAEVLRFLLIGGTLLLVATTSGAIVRSDVAGVHWVVGSLLSQTIPNATPTQLASHVAVFGTEIFFRGHLIFQIFRNIFNRFICNGAR